MTSNPQYQVKELPFLSGRTNALIQYLPDAGVSYQYTVQPILKPVNGPMAPEQFNQRDRERLEAAPVFEHDACADFPEYRRNSLRGRRRSHALQLAADYRQKPVYQFKKWFTNRDQGFLEEILDLIRAFCQGLRVSFSDKNIVWYEVNTKILKELKRELTKIRTQTLEIAKDRREDVPEIPDFCVTTRSQYSNWDNAVFARNDWEIIAAAYRCDVEAFILTCITLGYDPSPSVEEEEDEEPEEPAVYEEDQLGPRKVDYSVQGVINQSLGLDFGYTPTKRITPRTNEERMIALFGPPTPAEDFYKNRRPPSPLPDLFAASPTQHSTPTPKPNPELPISQTDSSSVPAISIPSVIPPYRETQTQRVFGGGNSAPEQSYRALTGTERFENMFKPSQYAVTENQPVSTPFSTPGAARAAPSMATSGPRSRVQFSLPASEPQENPYVSSEGAAGFGQPSTPYSPYGGGPPSQGFGSGVSFGPPRGPPPGFPGPPGPPGPGPGGGGPPPGGGYPPGPGRNDSSPNPPNPFMVRGGGPPGGDPPDPPSGGATEPLGKPQNNGVIQAGINKWINNKETHFDTKLKPEIVPIWNGDENTLGRWILQINEIAQRSASVFKGLGDIVPTRFRDSASSWWYSLQDTHRAAVSQNWDTLKNEIRTFWMNPAWADRMQRKALQAKYRESGHSKETPSEYYIRKVELLSLVYNLAPSQIMVEVLDKAPLLWGTVLTPAKYATLAEFQTGIKYHEELLIKFGDQSTDRKPPYHSRTYRVDARPKNSKNPSRYKDKDRDKKFKSSTRTYAVGATNPPKPQHPKDDANISKPKTPADYKARGCIFCGSRMHWDRDCKYNKDKAMRSARTMFVDSCSDEDILAELEYEKCYEDSQTAHCDFVEAESDQESTQEEEQISDHTDTSEESEGSDF